MTTTGNAVQGSRQAIKERLAKLRDSRTDLMHELEEINAAISVELKLLDFLGSLSGDGPSGGVDGSSPARPPRLSIAAAIRYVLDRATQPLATADVHGELKKMHAAGGLERAPLHDTVRALISRNKDKYGVEQIGSGPAAKWLKRTGEGKGSRDHHAAT